MHDGKYCMVSDHQLYTSFCDACGIQLVTILGLIVPTRRSDSDTKWCPHSAASGQTALNMADRLTRPVTSYSTHCTENSSIMGCVYHSTSSVCRTVYCPPFSLNCWKMILLRSSTVMYKHPECTAASYTPVYFKGKYLEHR